MKDFVIDAKNKSLGRVASEIAVLLQGKTEASYEPRERGNNRVVVKNLTSMRITGKKVKQKIYYRHTGYIGHLKSKTLEEEWEKNPEWVLRHAVRGMLPDNKLRPRRLKLLIIEK